MEQLRGAGIERFSPVFLTLEDPSAPPPLPRLPCEDRGAMLSFFGLKADPFPHESDPACYLGSQQHECCLEKLRRAAADAVPFGMLTARDGLGLRFVARTLRRALSVDACRVLELQVETGLTEKAFAKGLLHGLGFDWIYREQAPLHHLVSLVNNANRAARQKSGTRLVLLLVGAHRLSPGVWPVLKAISDFGKGGEDAVTILLFGDEGLREALQSRGLDSIRQKVFVRERLDPLTARQTGPYVQRRLARVGFEGPLFGPGTHEAIYHATAGVYRDVHSFAANALVRAFNRRRRVVDLDAARGA